MIGGKQNAKPRLPIPAQLRFNVLHLFGVSQVEVLGARKHWGGNGAVGIQTGFHGIWNNHKHTVRGIATTDKVVTVLHMISIQSD